jgi:hypothetical protein
MYTIRIKHQKEEQTMNRSKSIDFLLENADTPIRYRILREIQGDEKAAKELEPELSANDVVAYWLYNLKPETPPQHRFTDHGSFDFCLENAMLKCVWLGLHGGLPQVVDAVSYYLNQTAADTAEGHYDKCSLRIIENLLTLADIENTDIQKQMLTGLDEIYRFVTTAGYDLYLSDEERDKRKAVPKVWRNRMFIKPAIKEKYGFCYPLIYDIVGLHKLYGVINEATDEKINAVIKYISTDDFHKSVADGYGITIAGDRKYHSMGWDPKYPGWFNVNDYMENINPPYLLFFAQYISRYPYARETKWFNDLLYYLDKYKTSYGTYIFPAEWLKEKTGYAVSGSHISFGENRRKKNRLEIESTFYMLLLEKSK